MKPIRLRPSFPTAPTATRTGKASDDPLKREMEKWYSAYSKTYDRDGWHTRIARRLVEGMEIGSGDRILDLATGTGLAGIMALEAAGKSGKLIGVDISSEMLKVAEAACKAKELENVEFVLGDAQQLDFEEGSFDLAICSSALVLFPDVAWTLNYWKKFLKPDGQLAVHCFSEDSYIRGKLIQKAASAFGIDLVFSEPTGTIEKCRSLMKSAGYVSIRIEEEKGGQYLDLDAVLDSWDRMILHPMVQLPSLVDASTLQSIKDRYRQLANDCVTENGVWDEDTIMYVYGRRPKMLD